MDTLTNRQQAIEAAMRAYRAEFVQIGQDIEPMMALDHERRHYQFFWYGWQNDRHIFSVAFHAQLRDRKIWMLQDKTEEGFANYLVAQGVPKSDIVLAYYPPAHRQLTEYAVG